MKVHYQGAPSLVKSLTILLAWCALIVLSPALANGQIVNGGFETGSLSPWYQVNACDALNCVDWAVTNLDSHSGTYSAQATGNLQLKQDFAPVPTANILSLSFWLRHPNLQAFEAVDFYYSDNSREEKLITLESTDWEFFDVTSMLDAGKSLSGLGLWGYRLSEGTPDDITRYDDVMMSTSATNAVPEPASLALLATGLISLVPMIRRRVRR